MNELPPYLPGGGSGPVAPAPVSPQPGMAPVPHGASLTTELIALGTLIVVALLLPDPWGIRIAVIILAGWFLTSTRHTADLQAIVDGLTRGIQAVGTAGQ